MRNLTAAIQTIIAKNLGNEPVNILEVQWGSSDGPWTSYADKDIVDYEFKIDGKILSISKLESIIKLDHQGQSQGLVVLLSDTGGDLKEIFNNVDIHGKRCILYQWFEGIPLSERFQLYEGEIISPIKWSEGDRTLKFDVITKLSDVEVGFSPEEGLFWYLPESVIGNPWPLIFGSVQNVPCTVLSEIPETQITDVLGAEDPTIESRLSELNIKAENALAVWYFYIMAAGVCGGRATDSLWNSPEQAQFWSSEYQKWLGYQNQYESAADQAIGQYYAMLVEKESLLETLADQKTNVPTTITVSNGSAFPQNVLLDFEIGDLNVSGSFNGNILTLSSVTNPDYVSYDGEPFGFTFVQAGTVLRLLSVAPIIYIVSLIEAQVLNVQAYRTVENGKILVTVPSSYYEVITETMGPYNVTYIKMQKPLSSYESTFENKLYATVTTSVGPNTVDIIEWLITTYTNLSIDTTSFNLAQGYVDNYPSHFALLERKNILTTIEEVAFQARCAIWLSNGTFYIKYLPRDETPVVTLTEEDIDTGTLVVSTVSSEELVTKLIVEWTDNYALDKYSFVLRNNGARYGIKERTLDFYIYNIGELVAKSATFWLIRLSNVWKEISFSTYIDNLLVETFDLIELDFTETYIASGAVSCDVLQAIYNLETQTLDIVARVPIRCGEMEEYPFYKPQNISVNLLFPTDEEINQGFAGSGGIGETVEGGLELESNFKNSGSYNVSTARDLRGPTYTREFSKAEEKPTDVDDVKPEPNFSQTDVYTSTEPEYDYRYPAYPIDAVPSPDEDTPDVESSCFPGKVTWGSDDTYLVDVYKFGLAADPENLEVKQLDIAANIDIPVNTWVLVAYNSWEEIENIGEEDEKIVVKFEYTMQVPVWL
ncbi:hypothetical protein LCGC14_1175710 [marine sediment metagenome]|uniref:Tip attachment protein J domain-containing protein n=1 Tax=marine sediment metagenome TaxID=412755 RepID=A0A0F9PU26_9ZZZZ